MKSSDSHLANALSDIHTIDIKCVRASLKLFKYLVIFDCMWMEVSHTVFPLSHCFIHWQKKKKSISSMISVVSSAAWKCIKNISGENRPTERWPLLNGWLEMHDRLRLKQPLGLKRSNLSSEAVSPLSLLLVCCLEALVVKVHNVQNQCTWLSSLLLEGPWWKATYWRCSERDSHLQKAGWHGGCWQFQLLIHS